MAPRSVGLSPAKVVPSVHRPLDHAGPKLGPGVGMNPFTFGAGFLEWKSISIF